MRNIKTYGQALFEAKQDTANFYFLEAAGKMDVQKALDMIELGADLNAISNGGGNTIGIGWGALHYLVNRAFSSKSKKTIKELIKAGADPNIRSKGYTPGLTPLHTVAKNMWRNKNEQNYVKLLLELGADVNALDDQGRNPLDSMIDKIEDARFYSPSDHYEVAKALLDGGSTTKRSTKELLDFFGGDPKWMQGLKREDVGRIIKTKSIFNV